MGYLSCNADSAVATCDPHYCHFKNRKTNNLLQIRHFPYSDILAATKTFSADTFLGKGSHGSVYKATLDGGKLIAAVKKTKHAKPSSRRHQSTAAASCTGCGNCTSPAENEIEILSRVFSPRRLVNLIGFCTDPSNGGKLIVVEYMPNGSLHDLLHSPVRPPGWTARVRLALQIAKAVHALHTSNPPVIHRDIKSSNVLIDGAWNARLGDFGLALRGHVEDVRVKCTPPAGTLGYLDPCYLAPEDLSAKSDVFSFGILLLEILSGRNAIDVNFSPPSVVDWAVPLIKRGEFAVICDRRIGAPSDKEVVRMVAVMAAMCVRSTAEKRPSMEEVVQCLKIARKRMRAAPIWSGLRWRVRRVESEKRLEWEARECDSYYDRSEEEVVRAAKGGVSRRKKNRKVSNVTGAEYYGRPSSNHVVRSKSIGAGSLKVNSDSGSSRSQQSGSGFVRRRSKLNKSRSMGVLQGSSRLSSHYYESDPIHSLETAMSSKWVITDKLEKKLLEKPLVNSVGIN
ncbi:serine/threonine-protein kinase-like protein At1g28390 [Arachis stenosperma]|uniref:serine/threonine-protein kinase-like protein At1g28390 n=1 Tax=Arachis stenosperma TaxID=217475 RepID=UPI0025ABDA66|nr:serine/threonine-protein kinase-like protein At1g28390 [Arachis stenosperma]